MLQSQTHHHHLLSSNFHSFSLLPIHHHHHYPRSHSLFPHQRSISISHVSAAPRTRPSSWLAQVDDELTANPASAEPNYPPEEGPVELPSFSSSIFATNDDPTVLQVATSVLLTGAIGVFLFRSIRRRAKRAKELRFRASGAKKTLKEEALDNLKVMGTAPLDAKAKPSPFQALVGGLAAGVIALILYKFTTTIEAALNRQTLSDNFSVRQITITVRTIVNGLSYLATFVFGLNSVGLLLYSGQLAINASTDESSSEPSRTISKEQLSSAESPTEGTEASGGQGDLKSDDKQ